MAWEGAAVHSKKNHRQVIDNGFVLTEGKVPYSGSGTDFDMIYLPTFGLLQVHEGHSMEVFDCGRGISVRPKSDKRLIGQIIGDKNPKVYDSAIFVLAPSFCGYGSAGEVVGELDGFKRSDGKTDKVNLVYYPKGAAVDEQGIRTFSMVTPAQIHHQFYRWATSGRNVYATYKDKMSSDVVGMMSIGDGFRNADISRRLEDRFGVRILAEDKC